VGRSNFSHADFFMFVDPQSLHSADEGSSLLFLLWDELFDPEVLDTYRPKFHHLFSLCQELLDVTHTAKTWEPWKKYIGDVQAELLQRLPEETSFLSQMDFERWEFEQLTLPSEPYQLHSACRVLLSKWTPSLENGVQDTQIIQPDFLTPSLTELREAVSGLPKDKGRAIDALRRVATVALWSGRFPSEIRTYISCESLTKSPSAIIDTLEGHLKSTNLLFRCALKIGGPENSIKSVVRVQGFNPIPKEEKKEIIISEDFVRSKKQSWSEDDVIVGVQVEAESPAMAAMTAMSNVRPAIDTLNFYENEGHLFIDGTIAVFHERAWCIVRAEDQSGRKLRSRDDARSLTKKVLKKISEQKLHGNLINALELHSVFKASSEPRVKLVNLWAAMECLVESSGSKNVLANICQSVAPIIAWRRVERILHYLGRYIHYWWLEHRDRTHTRFPNNKNKTLRPELLLWVLTREENHPEILELFRFVEGHPLLVNRTFELWKTLHDPQVLLKNLLA
jgi:hypothetical protein